MARQERGTVRERRDGSLCAKNLSGSTWDYAATQRDKAEQFAQSVCQRHHGGGLRFLFAHRDGEEYEWTVRRLARGHVTFVNTFRTLLVTYA